MKTRTWFLALAVMGLAVSTSRSALAERGAVLMFGTSSVHQRNVVKNAISDKVGQSGWVVLDAPFGVSELDAIQGCLARDRPWKCIEPIAHGKTVERIVTAEVDPHTGGGVDIIEQVLLPGDGVPSLQRRYCSPCGDQELTAAAQELTELLLERAVAQLGNTLVEVRSMPTGAVVQFDGTMSGTTNASIKTSPGHHTVILQLSGYQPAERPVTVQEGQTAVVDVQLAPASTANGSVPPPALPGPSTSTTPPAADTAHRSRVVPGVLIGVGVVAIAGGIVTMALNQDPPSPMAEQPKRLYHTIAPGVGVAIGGVAITAVGGYLWWRYSHTTSTPTVTATTGGGLLGWSTEF